MGYDPREVTFYSVSPVALCPVYISPPEQEILDIYIYIFLTTSFTHFLFLLFHVSLFFLAPFSHTLYYFIGFIHKNKTVCWLFFIFF